MSTQKEENDIKSLFKKVADIPTGQNLVSRGPPPKSNTAIFHSPRTSMKNFANSPQSINNSNNTSKLPPMYPELQQTQDQNQNSIIMLTNALRDSQKRTYLGFFYDIFESFFLSFNYVLDFIIIILLILVVIMFNLIPDHFFQTIELLWTNDYIQQLQLDKKIEQLLLSLGLSS